jgi:hypothetical protein
VLQLRNRTGLAGTVFASPDPDGVDTLYAVVKGTFSLSETPTPLEEQVPVAVAARHWGDPATTSVRVPSDVSLLKPGADVLLLGSARAPGGRPVPAMDVGLALGGLRRVLRVFGDRVWRRSPTGFAASAPQPFVSMPLVWERAWGGGEEVDGRLQAETRNPVGVGFRARGSVRSPEGTPLPNVEDPRRPLLGHDDAPAPAGTGPLAAHWHPRRAYAGTYDDRWLQERAPYLPRDFDARFFQLAPPEQVLPRLAGGERGELHGLSIEGPIRFRLPTLAVTVTYRLAGGAAERPAALDTVLLEPDEKRMILVWRAALAVDKRLLQVREIDVAPAA